jgi:hypothetical protein
MTVTGTQQNGGVCHSLWTSTSASRSCVALGENAGCAVIYGYERETYSAAGYDMGVDEIDLRQAAVLRSPPERAMAAVVAVVFVSRGDDGEPCARS